MSPLAKGSCSSSSISTLTSSRWLIVICPGSSCMVISGERSSSSPMAAANCLLRSSSDETFGLLFFPRSVWPTLFFATFACFFLLRLPQPAAGGLSLLLRSSVPPPLPLLLGRRQQGPPRPPRPRWPPQPPQPDPLTLSPSAKSSTHRTEGMRRVPTSLAALHYLPSRRRTDLPVPLSWPAQVKRKSGAIFSPGSNRGTEGWQPPPWPPPPPPSSLLFKPACFPRSLLAQLSFPAKSAGDDDDRLGATESERASERERQTDARVQSSNLQLLDFPDFFCVWNRFINAVKPHLSNAFGSIYQSKVLALKRK